jgi:hypothetical protein
MPDLFQSTQIQYRDGQQHECACHLLLYVDHPLTIAIVSDVSSSLNSVADDFETLIEQVAYRFELPPENLLWLERLDPANVPLNFDPNWAFVLVQSNWFRDGKRNCFTFPRRSPLTLAQVEGLIGQPLPAEGQKNLEKPRSDENKKS